MLSGIANGTNLTLHATVTKTAGYQDSIHIGQILGYGILIYGLRINPLNVDSSAVCHTTMLQGLYDTDIGIVKRNIFAYQTYGNFMKRMLPGIDHCSPLIQIRLRTRHVQSLTGTLSQTLLLHLQRNLIKHLAVQILQYMGSRHITEQADLLPHMGIQRIFGTTYQNIRLESQSLHSLYTGLSGLGLHFTGGFQIGNQSHMNQTGVLLTYIVLELTDGLQERLAFDIAYGTAYLDNGNLRLIIIFVGIVAVETVLDLVGDMGDNLYSASAVITSALS
jgi:hypothetical protein